MKCGVRCMILLIMLFGGGALFLASGSVEVAADPEIASTGPLPRKFNPLSGIWVANVSEPSFVSPNQTFPMSISIKWHALHETWKQKAPPYDLHVGLCSGVSAGNFPEFECNKVLWRIDDRTQETSGYKTYSFRLKAPTKAVCWYMTAFVESSATFKQWAKLAVDVAERGESYCADPKTSDSTNVNDLCITNQFMPFCFVAQFRVGTSFSSPLVGRQGDVFTTRASITYEADYVHRGPLRLMRFNVTLNDPVNGSVILSEIDKNPPTLQVGEKYERDFKFDLIDLEKPGFYRLVLTWAIGAGLDWSHGRHSIFLLPGWDSDEDGIFDRKETKIGSDPLNPDSDNDGLSDGAEFLLYQTDPIKQDTDDDGLSDAAELTRGTDPLNADTDGDGLLDGREDLLGTDPFAPDSDHDFWKDGIDIQPRNPLIPNAAIPALIVAVIIASLILYKRRIARKPKIA